jgi:hypothetical protein
MHGQHEEDLGVPGRQLGHRGTVGSGDIEERGRVRARAASSSRSPSPRAGAPAAARDGHGRAAPHEQLGLDGAGRRVDEQLRLRGGGIAVARDVDDAEYRRVSGS